MALLAVVSIVFASAALIGPAVVSAGAPGNNGTLKVHEFGTPSGTESNDPKVCNFNFEGFGFDHGQSGYIVIEGQGQTSGTFDLVEFGPTNADGYAATGYQTLPDGHYKATLYGKDTGQTGVDLTDEKAKSKVFKVDCVTDVDPEPTPTPDDGGDDDAALNIRKVDEEGRRLEGAVFTVDGLEGTFTTGRNGQFCITGLPADSEYLVTEIEAPEGYEISDEPSQMVEVDDDGSGLCASPDAVFVNTLAEEETPTPTPTPTPVVNPTPTPNEGEEGGSPTPTPSPSPRGGVQGGNPTPRGGVQGGVPDTAMQPASDASLPILLALLLTASLVSLGYVKVTGARARDIR